MKKLKALLTTFLMLFILVFVGCGQTKEPTIDNKEIFEEELTPIEGEELEAIESPDTFDEEMTSLDEEEFELAETTTDDLTDINEADTDEDAADADNDTTADTDSDDTLESETSGAIIVVEDGTYTGKDEVASYIHQFGKLPSNFITKSEAQDLGWDSKTGNLDEVAPGKSIGGDKFGNYEKMLPVEDGRTYWECDIDYEGGYRNEKRIIYSNDGLIFYTGDHYETFVQLY